MSITSLLTTIITAVFVLVILSYYVLVFIKTKKPKHEKTFSSLTVIIPAHNEEPFLQETIQSVKNALFSGHKQIIIVDDGSIDNTYKIAKQFESKNILVLQSNHKGKAAAINKALKKATGELVAIVDADSTISRNSLQEMARDLARKNVAASCCAVHVKNRHIPILMWVHIEQIYNSLIRLLFSKINANVVTPGPLSMYRQKDLEHIGGFTTDGFSEDINVTIKLIRSGKKVTFTQKAQAYTNMPHDVKGFFRQRTRFARGMIHVLKKNLQVNAAVIDLYTLPLLLFNYLQAVIMGGISLYQIISGYNKYFLAKEAIINKEVFLYFFDWFSIIGFVKWTYNTLIGIEPLTLVSALGIISTLLTYPLFIFAILRFDKKIDLFHIIPIFFMFPFWLLIMIIYIICIPEYFKKTQYNIWKKNE